MLGAPELTGAVVTMDAGNASKATATAVIEAKADYVITVKSNRRRLHTALRELFEAASSGARGAPAPRRQQTRETGHGRQEVRDVWVAPRVVAGGDVVVLARGTTSRPRSSCRTHRAVR